MNKILFEQGHPVIESRLESAKVIYTLTGFEFFDALASFDRRPLDIIPTIQRLARAVLGLPGK